VNQPRTPSAAPETAAETREARELRLYVEEIVADAPPLDEEQAELIRSILRPAIREWAREKAARDVERRSRRHPGSSGVG
jgi:hypothetical protein